MQPNTKSTLLTLLLAVVASTQTTIQWEIPTLDESQLSTVSTRCWDNSIPDFSVCSRLAGNIECGGARGDILRDCWCNQSFFSDIFSCMNYQNWCEATNRQIEEYKPFIENWHSICAERPFVVATITTPPIFTTAVTTNCPEQWRTCQSWIQMNSRCISIGEETTAAGQAASAAREFTSCICTRPYIQYEIACRVFQSERCVRGVSSVSTWQLFAYQLCGSSIWSENAGFDRFAITTTTSSITGPTTPMPREEEIITTPSTGPITTTSTTNAISTGSTNSTTTSGCDRHNSFILSTFMAVVITLAVTVNVLGI